MTFHVRMLLSALAEAMMDWSGAMATASTSSEWLLLPYGSGWMVWKHVPVLMRHSLMVLSVWEAIGARSGVSYSEHDHQLPAVLSLSTAGHRATC